MDTRDKERFIQQKASENRAGEGDKVLWSLHAVRKLRQERLRRQDVEECLQTAEIIEDYPTEGRPLPDCLVLGWVISRPVHAVVAADELLDRVVVVTVYRPVPERWDDEWKQRKSVD